MPPGKAKRQPSTPVYIRSDDDDYIDSELSLSDASGTSREGTPSDMDLTPSKPRTRGRVMEPPMTPSPKKTTASGTKRSVQDEKEIISAHQGSPTKKQRTAKDDIKDMPASKSTKSANKPRAKILTANKIIKKEEEGIQKDNVNLKVVLNDNKSDLSDINDDEGAESSSELKDKKGKYKSTPQLDSKTVYIEDVDPEVKVPALKACGVFNKESVDDLLKNTYSKLPKLPGGKHIIGWNNPSQQNTEDGFAFFSSVKEIFPKADMKYLRDLICFQGDKSVNVTNLSRADPELFCLRVPGGIASTSYICYRGSMVPVRCLMMGLVHEDRTRAAYQLSTGKWMKSLSLIPFALEADRMITATAVIYDTQSFHGQVLNGNIISFATRQGLSQDTSKGSPSSSKAKRGRFAKPTSAVGSSTQITVMGVRGPEEDIPILDAREKKLKLPDNVKNIVETFPRFSGSVPQDSVVLACYTTSKYEKNNDLYASFNILWAAVLCGDDA